MNPLEFLFMLLQKYASVSPQRLTVLEQQAKEWYGSKTAEENRIAKWIKEKGELWYIQLGLSVLFIFAVRWVHDFMNPTPERHDEKDGW